MPAEVLGGAAGGRHRGQRPAPVLPSRARSGRVAQRGSRTHARHMKRMSAAAQRSVGGGRYVTFQNYGDAQSTGRAAGINLPKLSNERGQCSVTSFPGSTAMGTPKTHSGPLGGFRVPGLGGGYMNVCFVIIHYISCLFYMLPYDSYISN